MNIFRRLRLRQTSNFMPNNLDELINEVVALFISQQNTSYTSKNVANWDTSNLTTFENFISKVVDQLQLKAVRMSNKQINILLNSCLIGIGNWNVSNVTNTRHMFSYCSKFNQPLNNWNVSNVSAMSFFCHNCNQFNQSLIDWRLNDQTYQHYDTLFSNRLDRRNWPSRPRHIDQGIAYQIHNEFANISIVDLNSILDILHIEIPNITNFSDSQFIQFIKEKFQETINNRDIIEPSQKQTLLTVLDSLFELSVIPTTIVPLKKTLLQTLTFVLQQPSYIQSSYIKSYLEECGMSYGTNVNIQNFDPQNMSCVKGRFERIITILKTVLLEQCLENSNDKQCSEIYKRILKEVFNVDVNTSVVELDKNEVIQSWNAQHLDNDEFKRHNNIDNMNEQEKNKFFKTDFILFMTNAYKKHNLLTNNTQQMINEEANLLEQAGVFINLMFGGRKKTALKNIKKTYKRSIKIKKSRKTKTKRKIRRK